MRSRTFLRRLNKSTAAITEVLWHTSQHDPAIAVAAAILVAGQLGGMAEIGLDVMIEKLRQTYQDAAPKPAAQPRRHLHLVTGRRVIAGGDPTAD
jgi:hypothetical protein